jgi:hypothetical protein
MGKYKGGASELVWYFAISIIRAPGLRVWNIHNVDNVVFERPGIIALGECACEEGWRGMSDFCS